MENTLYIIDENEQFEGSCISSMSAPETNQKPKYVDYSSSLHNDNKGNLTFEEYKDLPENKGKKLVAINNKKMDELLKIYYKGLKSKFKEITETRYNEMLECLPPMDWHNYRGISIFFIVEAYTGSMHSCFIKTKGKHYEALRDASEGDEALYKDFRKDTIT